MKSNLFDIYKPALFSMWQSSIVLPHSVHWFLFGSIWAVIDNGSLVWGCFLLFVLKRDCRISAAREQHGACTLSVNNHTQPN